MHATYKTQFNSAIRTKHPVKLILPKKSIKTKQELNARCYLRHVHKTKGWPPPSEEELEAYFKSIQLRTAGTPWNSYLRINQYTSAAQEIEPAKLNPDKWAAQPNEHYACRGPQNPEPSTWRRLHAIPRRHWRQLEVRLSHLRKIYHLTEDQIAPRLDLHPADFHDLTTLVQSPDFRE